MNLLIIISAILLISVTSVKAEILKLTVNDAINLALKNNNQIKASHFKSKASEQGVISANARYYPSVLFEETAMLSNSPSNVFMMKLDEGRFSSADFSDPNSINHPDARHDFKTALTVQQPLFVPSVGLLKEIAIKESKKSELEVESARQSIAFQVFYSYLEVQKAEANLKAAEKAVDDAMENMRLASVRVTAGVGLKSDELRSRTNLAMVEQQVISARNNLRLAHIKLEILIGMPEDTDYVVSELLQDVSVPVITDLVVAEALQNRVEVRQSQIDLEKSDVASRLARSEFFPTLGAFASYQLNAKEAPFTSDNDAWVAGISLKWVLFDGFYRYSERNRALLSQAAAHEMLESTTKEIRYQLKESYLRREEVGKRVEVAKLALLDAEETVRLLSKRYENSLATMVELLDAQSALNQVRANLVETEAGYALAGGRIYFMSGTFVKEILK